MTLWLSWWCRDRPERFDSFAMYRFYHQSLKVFSVQEVTVRIVQALQHASPEGAPLNEWFMTIRSHVHGRSKRPVARNDTPDHRGALLYLYNLRN